MVALFPLACPRSFRTDVTTGSVHIRRRCHSLLDTGNVGVDIRRLGRRSSVREGKLESKIDGQVNRSHHSVARRDAEMQQLNNIGCIGSAPGRKSTILRGLPTERIFLRGVSTILPTSMKSRLVRLAVPYFDPLHLTYTAFVTAGQLVHTISEHSHFVQGVAWDPLGRFIATQSSDRYAAICSPYYGGL